MEQLNAVWVVTHTEAGVIGVWDEYNEACAYLIEKCGEYTGWRPTNPHVDPNDPTTWGEDDYEQYRVGREQYLNDQGYEITLHPVQ